jgi:hypothetical protein
MILTLLESQNSDGASVINLPLILCPARSTEIVNETAKVWVVSPAAVAAARTAAARTAIARQLALFMAPR